MLISPFYEGEIFTVAFKCTPRRKWLHELDHVRGLVLMSFKNHFGISALLNTRIASEELNGAGFFFFFFMF